MGNTPTNEIGNRYGKLVVLRQAPNYVSPKGKQATCWLCKCDCGNEVIAIGNSLRAGKYKSCGCYHIQTMTDNNPNFVHGAARGYKRTSEYYAWRGMQSRCYTRTNKKYELYGGRGIIVCERWRSDFTAFLTDMGPRPSALYSLDRIDNNGPYSPTNCRWATTTQQAQNKRNNVQINAFGHTLSIQQWAKRSNLSVSVIRQRLHRGWDAERAVAEALNSR